MRKQLKSILFIFICMILCVNHIYGDDNSSIYKFSCTYDNIKFASDSTNVYSFKVEVYDNKIMLYNITNGSNDYFPSGGRFDSHGIEERGGSLYYDYKNTEYFYSSDGKLTCPTSIVDLTDETQIGIYFDNRNPEKKLVSSSTGDPSEINDNFSGYMFSCDYNIKLASDSTNVYSFKVDVYQNKIMLYNNTNGSNDYFPSGERFDSHGIEERGGSLYYDSEKTEYFYTSDGNATCPSSVLDLTDETQIGIYFDNRNPEKKIVSSSIKGPYENNPNDEVEVDSVLFDCNKEGYEYYYKPGEYNLISINFFGVKNDKKKVLVLDYHANVNIRKYKSGKTEIDINYGDGTSDTFIYDYTNKRIDGEFVSKTKQKIMVSDLGDLNTCPEKLKFCTDGESDAVLFTLNSDVCDFSENAVDTVNKATAEEYGEKFSVGSIGGSISKDGLSCDKLFSSESGTKLKEFIQSAFTIVKVVSICICIMMGVFDFVMSTSKDKDVLMETVNKTIKRLIIVIIILLLPTLIDTFGGIFGVSTCGIR